MIYYVEDDLNIRELVIYTLVSAGYEAKGLASGQELFEALSGQKAQLVLLDIMLPDEDCISILKSLKKDSRYADIPVIMVTAKGAEFDKVLGLEEGADDYITKPFGMMEFLARVKALLRRTGEKGETNIYEMERLKLDDKRHQVVVDNEEVKLTVKEFEMLKFLLQNRGIVVTRNQILSQIWGYSFEGETRTVDVHVNTLRQKLGGAGSCIETVRGVGYRIL